MNFEDIVFDVTKIALLVLCEFAAFVIAFRTRAFRSHATSFAIPLMRRRYSINLFGVVTDSKGLGWLRVRNRGPKSQSLRVLPEESLTPGKWRAVEAPATVTPETEAKITLERMP